MTIGSKQPTNYPFWNEKTAINARKFVRFLEDLGFGQYQASPGRTASKSLIRRVDNVIQIHDPMSARRVVSQHIENDSNLDPDTKDDVLDKIGRMTASTILTYAGDLTVWSQQGYEGTNTLKIMADTATQCFLPFENGVVVISKDADDEAPNVPKARLRSYEVLGDHCVWESSIIKHSFSPQVTSGIYYEGKGLFTEFAKFALHQDLEPDLETHKPYNYKHFHSDKIGNESYTKYNEVWDAFTTAYGYLIHLVE